MKVTEFNDKTERIVVSAMIHHPTVLARIASQFEPDLFASPDLDRIAGWCVEHYRKHETAPDRGVRACFTEWEESGRTNPDEAKRTAAVLESLWADLERDGREINPDQIIDLASRAFNRNKALRLSRQMADAAESGKSDHAWELLTKARKVELGTGSGIDLFCDLAAMESTYAKDVHDPIVSYPGGLGRFFGPMLARDKFVAFMGVEKSGKSWWLLDVAYRAMLQRRRVGYFQIGDLSEAQIKDRFLVRAKRHPSLSCRDDGKWPCTARWPVKIVRPTTEKSDTPEIEFRDRTFTAPLNATKGWAAEIKEAVRAEIKSDRPFLKLVCTPTKTLSVPAISTIVDSWILNGYIPDVIVVDYADCLAPSRKWERKLDQIQDDWEQLRKLSQRLHCLLVTATQAAASAYGKWCLDRRDFSGNHLKMAEVRGMVAINFVGNEKKLDYSRLSWIVRDTGQFSPYWFCHVAGCLSLGAAAVRSNYSGGDGGDSGEEK